MAPGSVNLIAVVVIPLVNLSTISIMRAKNSPKQIRYEKNFKTFSQTFENFNNFIVSLFPLKNKFHYFNFIACD